MTRPGNQWMVKTGPVWALPFLVPIALAIGYFLGRWLDRVFGTQPWLTAVMTGFGLAAGLYESARILIEASREDRD